MIYRHVARDGRVSYHVRVYLDGQKRYVGSARRLQDARAVERAARDREWRVRRGLEVRERAETFGDLAPAWAARRRERGVRSWRHDVGRVRNHLMPHFGKTRLDRIGVAELKAYIDDRRRAGLGEASVLLTLRLLGRFFSEMVEEGRAARNPVRMLDRHSRPRSRHDPRRTPFVRRAEDVRRVYLALPDAVRPAYALGALAGLRTGEVLGLRWEDVDLGRGVIHVQRSRSGPLKDDESRVVPVLDSLAPVLAEQRLLAGGRGHVAPGRVPGRPLDEHALGRALRGALAACGLPAARDRRDPEGLNWYRATRHTFASHWVMGGGSIEKLREVLGHCSVTVTERYAHLAPDVYDDRDRALVGVDLRPGRVVAFEKEAR